MDVAMEISRLENQSQTLDSGVEPEDTSRGSTTATERVAEVRNPSTLSYFLADIWYDSFARNI